MCRIKQEVYIEEAKHQRSKLILELYSKLRSQGYSMVLLSKRPQEERNSTAEQLKYRGYSDWSGLIMRFANKSLLLISFTFDQSIKIFTLFCLQGRCKTQGRVGKRLPHSWSHW